jgi:hypothetical protein
VRSSCFAHLVGFSGSAGTEAGASLVMHRRSPGVVLPRWLDRRRGLALLKKRRVLLVSHRRPPRGSHVTVAWW